MTFEQGMREFEEGNFLKSAHYFEKVTEEEYLNHKAWNAWGICLSKVGDYDRASIKFRRALLISPENTIYQKNFNKNEENRNKSKILKEPLSLYENPDQENIFTNNCESITTPRIEHNKKSVDKGNRLEKNPLDSIIGKKSITFKKNFNSNSQNNAPPLKKLKKPAVKTKSNIIAKVLTVIIFLIIGFILLYALNILYIAFMAYYNILFFHPETFQDWYNEGIKNSNRLESGSIYVYEPGSQDGTFNKAIYAFDQALKMNPSDYSTLKNKADLLLNNRNYSDALIIYRQMNKLNPNDSHPIVGMAFSLFYNANYEESIYYINQILKKNPNSIQLLAMKGSSLYSLKRYGEAIEPFERAKDINPNYVIPQSRFTVSEMATQSATMAKRIIEDPDYGLVKKDSKYYINQQYEQAIQEIEKTQSTRMGSLPSAMYPTFPPLITMQVVPLQDHNTTALVFQPSPPPEELFLAVRNIQLYPTYPISW